MSFGSKPGHEKWTPSHLVVLLRSSASTKQACAASVTNFHKEKIIFPIQNYFSTSYFHIFENFTVKVYCVSRQLCCNTRSMTFDGHCLQTTHANFGNPDQNLDWVIAKRNKSISWKKFKRVSF